MTVTLDECKYLIGLIQDTMDTGAEASPNRTQEPYLLLCQNQIEIDYHRPKVQAMVDALRRAPAQYRIAAAKAEEAYREAERLVGKWEATDVQVPPDSRKPKAKSVRRAKP